MFWYFYLKKIGAHAEYLGLFSYKVKRFRTFFIAAVLWSQKVLRRSLHLSHGQTTISHM